MLIGEYTTKFSEKNRVALPNRFRKEIGTKLILTRGYEGALVLVNKKLWENIAKDVINGSFINKNIRETSRFLIAGAVEISLDDQGRFVIPSSLVKYARFKKAVTFIGLVNWVELWDSKKWDEKIKEVSLKSNEFAKELSNINSNNNDN